MKEIENESVVIDVENVFTLGIICICMAHPYGRDVICTSPAYMIDNN